MKRHCVLAAIFLGANFVTIQAQEMAGPQLYAPQFDGGYDPRVVLPASEDPPVPYMPYGQPAIVNNGPAPDEDLAARMARLEAENQRMQAELQGLQEQTARSAAMPASLEMADPARDSSAVILPQVQGEVKRLMWTKGDFKIVPYGWLWGNAVWNTQRTSPGSYTLFVLSRSASDESEAIVDARNTRLGIDVQGPQIPCLGCAASGGKAEIDFQGPFFGTENRGSVLLRHAYLEVKNEEFRLLAGQTWDVVSPLIPGMLMYSVGWDAGNIGYRRAQFRAERYLVCSDYSLLTLQASINQNVFPDVISNVRPEPSSWPVVEGRVAWTVGERRGANALPITFGVSGHVGQQQFDVAGGPANLMRNTWSANTDLRIPITQRLGFQAEVFTGENLGQFLGGIGQGIDPTTLQEIHATGGWAEFWYDWTPCLHSHLGYSVDDPDNADLFTVGERSYNQFFYTNVAYDVTKQFLVGLEVSAWKTFYVDQQPGDTLRVEFVAKYGF